MLTFLVERFASLQEAFILSKDVGPLSGETTYAVVGWLVAGAILAVVLRGRDVPERVAHWVLGILVALGFVLTFPPTPEDSTGVRLPSDRRARKPEWGLAALTPLRVVRLQGVDDRAQAAQEAGAFGRAQRLQGGREQACPP